MYNPSLRAIVFMEVNFMDEALKTQLKILKLSQIKPNFSELARQYDVNRRTVKSTMTLRRKRSEKSHNHIFQPIRFGGPIFGPPF